MSVHTTLNDVINNRLRHAGAAGEKEGEEMGKRITVRRGEETIRRSHGNLKREEITQSSFTAFFHFGVALGR